MRAVVYAEPGATPTVAEIPTPTATAGDIRVKVHASSINGFDNAVVSGMMAQFMEHAYPVVLGRDFAGTIDQVGADVTQWHVGDQVFGVVLTYPLQAGGLGEYLVIPADHNVAAVPSGLPIATAGALGLAGSAATTIVSATGIDAGDTVLMIGATGGVGAIAMQLAAARGATVIATATAAEVDHVRSFGAHHTVDYTGDLAGQVRAIVPDGPDVVLHMAGDPFAAAALARPGGRFATLLGVPAEAFASMDVQAHSVVADTRPETLASLADGVASGRIRVPIQRSYALDDAPGALKDFTSGTLGKLAVRVG
jgi:NADPH:quinone reductase-like Zn-dependent oxidoreductase